MAETANINIEIDYQQPNGRKKLNWFQRLFKRKYRSHNVKTMYDFFMYLFDLHHESRAMYGYIRENCQLCDVLITRYPSKKIRKRYNIGYDSPLSFQWWLMEQYFEGNLVEKQKGATDEVLPKQ